MADNVQGFNHLDEVLMHLGDQFRQEAIRNKLMENQRNVARIKAHGMGMGKAQGKSLQELKTGLSMMERDRQDFIRNNAIKDEMGSYIMTPEQANEEWMKANGPDYTAYKSQLNSYISGQNPSLKLPSRQPAPSDPFGGSNPINQNPSTQMLFGNGIH